jgi:hypothetical protein
MLTLTARQLYQLGYFNSCSIIRQPDGSRVFFCDGVKAPAPYHFQVRGYATKEEVLLYNPIVLPKGQHA